MKNFKISFIFIVFIIFTSLKLTDQLDWSWTWVTSPLWIPILLALFVIDIFFIVIFVFILFGVKLENTPFKFLNKYYNNNE